MTKQEGQVNYCESGKVGPVQETGTTPCWPGYRQTKLEGKKTTKAKSRVKKNSLKQSPNVTEHREATESEAALYGPGSQSRKGAGEERLSLA